MATTWETETYERQYAMTEFYFTKGEMPLERRPISRITGEKIVSPFSRERILNEAAALRFIADNTTIPVPKVLDILEDEGGYLSVRTSRISGVTLHAIEDGDAAAKAEKNVIAQVENDILPQLRSLQRNVSGSVDLDLPPVVTQRIWYRGMDRPWNRKICSRVKDVDEGSGISGEDRFVFCHGDLAQHNILIDPVSHKITGVLDWEYSGFFPSSFELVLWDRPWQKYVDDEEHVDAIIKEYEEYSDATDVDKFDVVRVQEREVSSLLSSAFNTLHV